ncbi:putative receptor-like protein kinase At3g47110 [Eucalyptus grandis]|uniref:putative receptor-like protein kinase At3g47110 n=1 Tax=Eucalyptus grandis TaxID=71139 RepID=UPI00192E8D00|nr:putative receptor-like protein kinase At3g47110 [Eucalyptus grandis]
MQRLNIAIDIATAIEYLHKGCYPAIVHGDLKPSNLLLDNDMMARVGDFGLAKIISTVSTETLGVQDQGSSTSTAVKGSIGYVPPEYGMGHKVSTLGDAYSYGILLLEMFTGKRPTEEAFGHHLNLHNFVRMALPDRAMDILDLRVCCEAGDRQQEMKIRHCIISVFEVGVACSMESPPEQMGMTEAIRKLHLIKMMRGAQREVLRPTKGINLTFEQAWLPSNEKGRKSYAKVGTSTNIEAIWERG